MVDKPPSGAGFGCSVQVGALDRALGSIVGSVCAAGILVARGGCVTFAEGGALYAVLVDKDVPEGKAPGAVDNKLPTPERLVGILGYDEADPNE
jgi:hypothetical protein|mmetsp:Transcript_79014/g.132441  ORF Transcript_79014/g.132441 Transcript_79014/m.132441 type:complete len:94 (+) Transcript_79014:1611-1892(+)